MVSKYIYGQDTHSLHTSRIAMLFCIVTILISFLDQEKKLQLIGYTGVKKK